MNRQSLQMDLASMGLAPTDTVLLHTSMKRIGDVEGGADAVLDALMAYFSPGLICFPALSWTVLEKKPAVFDVKNTQSIVGLLPEMFRRRPGVVRSHNPTHSVCAYGKDAAAFVHEENPGGTPCGIDSPWHRLMDRDAKILMIGCDLTACTFLHGVEEWCGVANRIGRLVRYTLILEDGTEKIRQSSSHCASPSENYGKIEPGLRKAGIARDHSFGAAPTILMNARSLYHYAAQCLRQNPHLFDEENKEQ